MCAIFGLVGTPNSPAINQERFGVALDTMLHRGPDAGGVVRLSDHAIFGHRRLAIIDLSPKSAQPFSIDDRYCLTYNGEIFNYIEIRDELVAQGVSFTTEGDVEVVLRAYLQWGDACVERFNGMWAFAVYDRQTGRLFASRDRFGIKPFNYCFEAGQLMFSSEIKAMLSYRPDLAKPDYNMIANFCMTSVGAQQVNTWFRSIKRLLPGHNLILDQGRLAINRYWDYPVGTDRSMTYEDAVQTYRALFDDAVRLRMRSDVPMGITLSAGVDSNSIVHVMHAVEPRPYYCLTSSFAKSEGLSQDGTIYVDAAKPIDEAGVARQVAHQLGMHSEIVATDYSNMVDDVQRIIHYLESGNSSPAVIPLMQLYEHARKHMTVVMDGQGADELLAGYATAVFLPATVDLIKRGQFRQAWRSLREYRQTYTLKSAVLMALRYLSNAIPLLSALHQSKEGLNRIYTRVLLKDYRRLMDWPDSAGARDRDALHTALHRQHAGGLVNLLHYGDAMSMAHSLEARMPFLDHRLVEYVWRLPGEFKVRQGIMKAVHRDAMRGLVPADILDEKQKWGYSTPISQQFRKDFPDGNGPVDLLLSERCLDRGLFDPDGLRALIDRHRSQAADHGPLLFRLLSVELWFREFIDKAQEPSVAHHQF